MLFDIIPLDLEDAVDHLHRNLTDVEKAYIVTHGYYTLTDTVIAHCMKKFWELELRKARLTQYFINNLRIGVPDTNVSLIFETFEHEEKGEPFDFKERAKFYEHFYKLQQIDPITGVMTVTIE